MSVSRNVEYSMLCNYFEVLSDLFHELLLTKFYSVCRQRKTRRRLRRLRFSRRTITGLQHGFGLTLDEIQYSSENIEAMYCKVHLDKENGIFYKSLYYLLRDQQDLQIACDKHAFNKMFIR